MSAHESVGLFCAIQTLGTYKQVTVLNTGNFLNYAIMKYKGCLKRKKKAVGNSLKDLLMK